MRMIRVWVTVAMLIPAVKVARAQDVPVLEQLGVQLTAADLGGLRDGNVVVKMLDTHRSSELAVFVGSRIDIRPERFFAAVRHSAELWRGRKVPRTGTFSSPVQTGDVDTLRLTSEDLDALRRCRPGDCDVKLAASEMTRVRRAIEANPTAWQSAAQAAFRAVVLDRIRIYRLQGLGGFGAIHDHRDAIASELAFNQVASGAAFSAGEVGRLVDYFRNYPRARLNAGAEHMYWLEVTDPPKPTLQAAHVVVDRLKGGGELEVVAMNRQIFATHYINASLSVTVLIRAPTGERLMLFINHSSVDGLSGFLSGLKRLFIRGRVRRAAQAAFEHLKRRIENYPEPPL
jgi:hypothetical protein